LTLLALAQPAPARVAYTIKGSLLQNLEIAEGVAFFRLGSELRRADLRTGEGRILHEWPYDDSNDYPGTIWAIEAGGGRVGVEIGEEGGIESKVVSLPAGGGPLTTVAQDTPEGAPCFRSVYLADVTEDGEVVTDETDCHSPTGRDEGTLFAYGPGGRRELAHRFVPHASALDMWDDVETAGSRYLVTRTDRRDPPTGVYVGDLDTGSAHTLAESTTFGDSGLNADGDAMFADLVQEGEGERERIRLFHRDGRVDEFGRPDGVSQRPLLCGRWLWFLRYRITAHERDLFELSAFDVRTSTTHQVFRREPERARRPGEVTCAGEGIAFTVHVRPQKEQIRVVAPPGGPATSGP
jgi:hypothetical protein